MARHRLYAAFWTHPETGRAMWGLHRNGRTIRRHGRRLGALVLSMPLPAGGGAWDAPTFRHCADRVELDARPAGCLSMLTS